MCRFAWLLCFVALAAEAAAVPPGLAELPQYEDFSLAPDGTRLLALKAGNSGYDLYVYELPSLQARKVFAPTDDSAFLNWCRWANNTRIVCSLRSNRGLGRVGQVTFTRLLALNFDGSEQLLLIPKARVIERRAPEFDAQVQDRVMNWLPEDPEHILLQLNRQNPNRPSVYRLNIYNNTLQRVARPREQVRRWFADHRGRLRMALGYVRDRDPVVYAIEGRRLRPFEQTGYRSEVPPSPLGYSDDGAYVYMNMRHDADHHGVYRVRLSDGAVVERIFTDPDFDVFGGLVVDPDTGEPAGISYLAHHPEMVWFDPRLKALFAHIETLLPGRHRRMVSADYGYAHFVFYVYGGVAPAYYLYDRKRDSVAQLGVEFPGLEDAEVADLQPVNYTSRDGLEIPGYLAVPPHGQRPFPTVLLPHGGPYARDSAEFDQWTQYLVSNGYAVFKPNYRGSVGYGELFMEAGYRQWGKQMQDDLMDGLDWLVRTGVADGERVCVVGASYGGYTALVSAYKHADRIRCAVSMAGISDLEKLVDRIYQFDLVQRNRDRIQSQAELKAHSPLHQVDAFSVPVLLVHGDADTVVRVRQSRRMAKALSESGKEFSFIEQSGGDHYLSAQRQRREFFTALGAFLHKHLRADGT